MKSKCDICGTETECKTITSPVVGHNKTISFTVCKYCAPQVEMIKEFATILEIEHRKYRWKNWMLLFLWIVIMSMSMMIFYLCIN